MRNINPDRYIRNKDVDFNEVCREHKSLVWYHAGRQMNAQFPIEDMVDEGFIGLMRAAELFDPSYGLKFGTYAHRHIIQAMIYEKHLGSLVRTTTRKKTTTQPYMLKKYAFIPIVDDYEPGDGIRIKDVYINPEDENDKFKPIEDRMYIEKLMESLNAQEKKVITMRYLKADRRVKPNREPKMMTLDNIAKKMNLSRERIRQIEEQALAKMRDYARGIE